MFFFEKIHFGSRGRKAALVILAAISVYTLFGFFLFPVIARSFLVDRLSSALNRKVEIENIKINPYALTLGISDLRVADKDDEPLMSFGLLYADLQISSVFKRALVVRSLVLEKPYMRIRRDKSGKFDFPNMSESSGGKNPSSGPVPFVLQDIRIAEGKVVFEDGVVKKNHLLSDVKLTLPFISSLPDDAGVDIEPWFSASLNGAELAVSGKSRPFDASLATRLNISVSGLHLPFYRVYLPSEAATLLKNAVLDTVTAWEYRRRDEKPPFLSVSGPVTLSRVEINDKAGSPMAELPELHVVLAPSELLVSDIRITKAICSAPRLRISRRETGELNIFDVLNQGKEPITADKSGQPSLGLSLAVDQFQLKGGSLIFTDLTRLEAFETTLRPVDITVESFSLDKGHTATYDVAIRSEAGESFRDSGAFSLNPFEIKGSASLDGLVLKKYAPYYGGYVLFDIEDGSGSLRTDYQVRESPTDFDMRLSALSLSIHSLALAHRQNREIFCRIPRFSAEGCTLDAGQRIVAVERLASEEGFVLFKRYESGGTNLQQLVAPRDSADKGGPVEKPAGSEPPWTVTLGEAAIENYAVSAKDLMVPEQAVLEMDRIRFSGKNLTTMSGEKARIEFSSHVNTDGRVSAKGDIGILPFSADLEVGLEKIELRTLQPYFPENLKIIITAGDLHAKGRLVVAADSEPELTTRYQGEISISNFSTVEPTWGKDLLSWKSLFLSGVELAYSPFSLKIDEAALSDFFGYLIIYPDGKVNLAKLYKADESQHSKSKPKTSPGPSSPDKPVETDSDPNIVINAVTLQNGSIDFMDQLIKPALKLDLLQVSGSISGLSSMQTEHADVHLLGNLESHSPLEIKGKINPFIENIYADIAVSFGNIDMPALTPYAGKYLGYALKRGSLTLELDYKVAEKRLVGRNKIVVDQIALGEKVKSPHATSLPISLAISLLQDRNGRIDLDVPIRGELSDPQFNLGKTIVQVIVNLFTKMITSPFSLIGALFGGGEELSTVDFDYGSPEIPETAKKKLDALIRALYERPALRLEIEGSVDPDKDSQALVETRFTDLIKAQKFREMAKKRKAAVPVSEIRIEPEEYEKYLVLAYETGDFPKPRNEFGQLKSLPVEEMEKLLYTSIQIGDENLRQLAVSRANNVKNFIMESKQVDPGRLFLIEPVLRAAGKKTEKSASRVNFRLR